MDMEKNKMIQDTNNIEIIEIEWKGPSIIGEVICV
jgi:hypothetical protein